MTEQLNPSTTASTAAIRQSTSQRGNRTQRVGQAVSRLLPVAVSIPSLRSRPSQGSKAPTRRPPGHREVWEVDEWTERLERARKAYVAAGCPKLHTCREIDLAKSPAEWVAARAKIVSRLGCGFTIALVGHRGPGKTQLAQQAIQAACEHGLTALYTRAMTVFLAIRATYGTDASEQSVIDHFSKPGLLVIDELHERGESLFENRMLNHLVDIRHGNTLDTLLVGNMTELGFEESMCPSITERLRETGGVIVCSWESFRK